MKFFSVIFSFYILILSLLPCNDTEDCKILNNGKENFAQIDHHNHQADTESCSPFCICACCGSIIVFSFQCPILTIKDTSFFPLNARIIIKNDSFASNFHGNIWQPPQI
ncbi:DUF6660 family protein [Arcicella sp. LKC2W]|uniref:DUF6660 family protein n=1 Tax=Arcicella sp. LKC2W TaxID=2984198 RepID=UPI003A4C55E3